MRFYEPVIATLEETRSGVGGENYGRFERLHYVPRKRERWPVFFDLASGKIAFVRSNLERGAVIALHSLGAVCFTPTGAAQLDVLQYRLGHRWRGRLVPANALTRALGWKQPSKA